MANFHGLSGALTGLNLKLEQNLPQLGLAAINASVCALDSASLDEEGLGALPSDTSGFGLNPLRGIGCWINGSLYSEGS